MIAGIKNVILRTLRSPKYLIFCALFPILLILIIGGLLGNYGDGNMTLSKKTVYYTMNGNNKETIQTFDILKENINRGDVKFDFIKAKNKDEAMENVKINSDLYLNIENNKVEIFTTAQDTISYTYLKSMIEGVNNGIKVANEVYKTDYQNAEKIMKENAKIPVEVLSKTQAPTGFNYYSIAEITMMCLYIISFPINGYFYDKKKKIKDRISLAGVTTKQYIIGSTIGYFLLSFLITAPGFIFSKVVLNANWGTNPLIYYCSIQVLAFMSILIGTLIIYIFDDIDKVMSIIQGAFLPILSFLGGAYMQLPYNESMGIFGYITYISPLRWINKGIFLSIYNGDNTVLINTIIGFLLVSVVIIGLIFAINKKEEVRI